MKQTFEQIMKEISEQISSIDLEGCNISIKEALHMVEFLQIQIHALKNRLLKSGFSNLPHFNKLFKLITSKTPSDYRESIKS